MSIGAGPQPYNGPADGHVELGRDHPGGLVDLGPAPPQIRRLPSRPDSGRFGCPIGMLAFEQDNNGSIGHNQGITGLRAGIQVV